MRQLDKLQYRVQAVLPTVYDDSLSFYELVNKVVQKLNEVIEETNEYFKKDLAQYVEDILEGWHADGTLENIINNEVFSSKANADNVHGRGINAQHPPEGFTPCAGDNATIDTYNLQQIINHANTTGIRKVFLPSGVYLIDGTINLNGCTLEGVGVHHYDSQDRGTVIRCATKTFTAIAQGSVSGSDIQFGVSDIKVMNARIGFNFDYVISSKFERLYAEDCDTGFKLGDLTKVGSMFCEFNQLWTQGCRIGAIVQSSDYFNNNVFNNGYIQGSEKAFHLQVDGGYGAVNNVFNNVEFKSEFGRGIILDNAPNTVFNNPYFECGGNAVKTDRFSPFVLNAPVFGLFKKTNTFGDVNLIHSNNSFRMRLNGGIIFFTGEYDNITFYGTNNPDTHLNITVDGFPVKVGTVTGFKWFNPANEHDVVETAKHEMEQTVNTDTVTVQPNGYVDVPFTYATVFPKIPEVCVVTPRGANYQGNTLSWILFEKLATGGQIRVYNNSGTTARTLNFNVYAKIIKP
jgi:hypothetical protein